MRLALFLVAVLFLPACASAQGFGMDTLQSSLTVEPAFPEPGQTVEVKINNNPSSLFGSSITWRHNGEVVPDSTNQRSIEVVAGPLGSSDTVEAIFSLPRGGTERMTATWEPIYLDIIIEPQVHTPSWYLGRGMPSTFSTINATAVVNNGKTLDPADLVYSWQVNNNVIDEGPVRGRNVVAFETPRGNTFKLYLTVSRAQGGAIARQLSNIEIGTPSLKFYEQHPLYGSSHFPISSSLPLIGNTVKLSAAPYNLDKRVYNDPDVAIWEINGLETNNGVRNPYEITLQRSATNGRTSVNFHVRSLQAILQGAEDSININF